MKTTTIAMAGVAGFAAWTVMAQPSVTVVVPAPPPPAVTVSIGVPDFYVWDGVEFVGLIGTQYVYLGPGDVWIAMDAPRLVRFHEWETAHADWRSHATANVKYRGNAAPPNTPPKSDNGAIHENHSNPGRGHVR
jgi:hypothetical protein